MSTHIVYGLSGGAVPSFVSRDLILLEREGIAVREHPVENVAHVHKLAGFVYGLLRIVHGDPGPVVFWMAPTVASAWASVPPWFRGRYGVIVGGGEAYAEKDSRTWQETHRALARAESASFVAPHLLERCLRNGHVLPRSVHVCPTWIPADVFRPAAKEPKTAALVGPFPGPGWDQARYRKKGVDRLALLAASNPDWTFHLVGGDRNVFPYGFLWRPFRNIVTHPYVQDPRTHERNVSALLARTKVILCLSREEGLPNALLEGMLAGCVPIVSPDVPSVAALAQEGGGVVLQALNHSLNPVMDGGMRAREAARRVADPALRTEMWRRMVREVQTGRGS